MIISLASAGKTLDRTPQAGDGVLDVATQGNKCRNRPQGYQATGHGVFDNGQAVFIFNEGLDGSLNGLQVHIINLIRVACPKRLLNAPPD